MLLANDQTTQEFMQHRLQWRDDLDDGITRLSFEEYRKTCPIRDPYRHLFKTVEPQGPYAEPTPEGKLILHAALALGVFGFIAYALGASGVTQ